MAVLGELIHVDDIASMMSALDTALEGAGYYSSEHRMVRPNDSEIWVHDRGRVVERNAEGKPLRMVGSINDITSRKVFERRLAETNRRIERSKEQLEGQVVERTAALARLNQELEELAKRDMLTGVGNRLRLDDWLVAQPEGNACVLVMLDVDHFKQVNDRYGHKVGDEVLQSIAQSLVLSVRRDDLVIRWGGEEFLIVLSPIDINQAVLIAENLRLRVSGLNALPDGGKVTASLGVAGGLCREFDRVLVEADSAMYVAKQAGRNRVMAAPQASEAIP
jgi:diguanylate cyclase (GGDEF)-like protein